MPPPMVEGGPMGLWPICTQKRGGQHSQICCCRISPCICGKGFNILNFTDRAGNDKKERNNGAPNNRKIINDWQKADQKETEKSVEKKIKKRSPGWGNSFQKQEKNQGLKISC
jgi:hypothetical protein